MYAPHLTDENFQNIYQQTKGLSAVEVRRLWELWDLVKEVSDVEGDILEIGVWRGGSACILAKAAELYKPDATVFLCDTFEGIVKASVLDNHHKNGDFSDTSFDMVTKVVNTFVPNNTKLLKGIFPDDTGNEVTNKIALCHIDVDVYQSALDILKWITPRLSSGSVIVFDDYGFETCQGITQLVNSYRAARPFPFFYYYNANGHAVLIKK